MTQYFKITPLEQDATFIEHNIISSNDLKRRWVATQIIGSQVGFRNFDNPVEQHEIDDLEIYSDPDLSGYKFDDEFDYVAGYKYRFDDGFSEEEQEALIDAYEGGTEDGVGASWVEMGDHEWQLDGAELLYFECPIKIDLIDENGDVIEEDVAPI